MKKEFLIFILLCFINTLAFAQTTYKKTLITKGIEILLPNDFQLMSDQDYTNKYGGYRKALAMYTNGKVDFGVNVALTQVPPDAQYAKKGAPWKREDIEMMRKLYKSSIQRLHSEVTFIQDEVREINEQNFAVFEFVAVVEDENNSALSNSKNLQQYSYIQYTVEDDKILIFNFTCPAVIKGTYQAMAKQMMDSIKIGSL